jgi:predicted transcriptional regulator
MSLVSIRLPNDVEARLTREAERTQRPKSEIARDAIVDYLQRTERDRFLTEIARAARDRDGADTLATAEEALPLDNESLAIGEGVREPSTKYGAAKKKRTRRTKNKKR